MYTCPDWHLSLFCTDRESMACEQGKAVVPQELALVKKYGKPTNDTRKILVFAQLL